MKCQTPTCFFDKKKISSRSAKKGEVAQNYESIVVASQEEISQLNEALSFKSPEEDMGGSSKRSTTESQSASE